jgi:hypothetical protein
MNHLDYRKNARRRCIDVKVSRAMAERHEPTRSELRKILADAARFTADLPTEAHQLDGEGEL